MASLLILRLRLMLVICIGCSFEAACSAYGADPDSGAAHWRPVYQRRAFEWADKHGHGFKHHPRVPPVAAPPVASGWFQRPYPYHLDYYRMRYGGSYAPYFGNLYGPPQVVTAPPYYGPYYGGWGGEYAPNSGPVADPRQYPGGMIYGTPGGNVAPPRQVVPEEEALPER